MMNTQDSHAKPDAIFQAHLVNVPTMVGGPDPQSVRRFVSKRLIGQFFSPDLVPETVLRTSGEDRHVDELIVSFTHTIRMDPILPT